MGCFYIGEKMLQSPGKTWKTKKYKKIEKNLKKCLTVSKTCDIIIRVAESGTEVRKNFEK